MTKKFGPCFALEALGAMEEGIGLDTRERVIESLLTDLEGISGVCENPACRKVLENGRRRPGTPKRYCPGSKCRTEAWAIRTVKRIVSKGVR